MASSEKKVTVSVHPEKLVLVRNEFCKLCCRYGFRRL